MDFGVGAGITSHKNEMGKEPSDGGAIRRPLYGRSMAMSKLAWGLILWFSFWSLLGAALSLYDKWAAVHRPRGRVRESTLMAVGALGGAGVMFLVMRGIRHKTLHRKFMVGLPMLFMLHVAAAACLLWHLR